jgi:hypothetical protein
MDTCLSTKVSIGYTLFVVQFICLFNSQYDQDSSSQIIDEAEWHNETSPGTVHYFRDENGLKNISNSIRKKKHFLNILGKLFSYVFGDASGQARMETSDPKPSRYYYSQQNF